MSEREVECKYCGEMGLHWEEIGGRFLLYDDDEERHECEERRQAQAAEEFMD